MSTFVEVLERYLALREKGPELTSGYTDKAWYAAKAECEAELNHFFRRPDTMLGVDRRTGERTYEIEVLRWFTYRLEGHDFELAVTRERGNIRTDITHAKSGKLVLVDLQGREAEEALDYMVTKIGVLKVAAVLRGAE